MLIILSLSYDLLGTALMMKMPDHLKNVSTLYSLVSTEAEMGGNERFFSLKFSGSENNL